MADIAHGEPDQRPSQPVAAAAGQVAHRDAELEDRDDAKQVARYDVNR
jgi:hypothetical protein